jgi:hypothetical protein
MMHTSMAHIVRSINACGVQAMRGLATASSSSGPYPRGMIEIREYTLKPEGAIEFLKLTSEFGDVRKALLPFLGCVRMSMQRSRQPEHACMRAPLACMVGASLDLAPQHVHRAQTSSPRSMFTTDVGPCLHKVTHMYHYKVREGLFVTWQAARTLFKSFTHHLTHTGFQ